MEQKLRRIPYYGTLALLAYMPFHIFLSQSLSVVTGGLSVWKAAKDVLTAGLVAITVILVWFKVKNSPQKKLFYLYLLLSICYMLLHLLIWALNPHIYRQSALIGLVYNNRLLWHLLIGLGAALLLPKQLTVPKVVKLVIAASSIVCVLGVLQYFLPKDMLTHFGYSVARGVKPLFFIDDKPDLPRIMSTLRDPNSLGAYLIVPIAILTFKLVGQGSKKRLLIGGLLLLHGLALFLTFSRSAWLAMFVSLAFIILTQLRARLWPMFLKYWPLVVGIVLLVGGLLLTTRHQYVVQNVLVHSDKSTAQKSKYDSNGYHWLFVRRGLEGIQHKPLGHGPGTAGLVSIQNPQGGFLTENYYVQIGYEVGILGLLVFVAANVLIYVHLLRSNNYLAVCLLASFWGYVLMNMLLHTWSNEAVAAQWWALAGVSLGISKVSNSHNKT